MRRVATEIATATSPLRVLSLHLTDRCNSHCKFCVVGIPDLVGDGVDQARLTSILLAQASRGFDAVNLHGGEPTLQKGFMRTLELIRELGYPRVFLQTNGWRLQRLEFVERLRDLNVELFIISLHGAEAAIHDAVTVTPGSFQAATQAIRNCKSVGCRVRTNTVLICDNIGSIVDIADVALSAGTDHVNISNLHPTMTAYKNFDALTPSVAESRRAVARVVDHIRRRGGQVTLEGFPYCLAPGLDAFHLRWEEYCLSMDIRGNWLENYEQFMDKVCRVKGQVCVNCRYEDRCGGVYREYIEKRGWGEFQCSSVECEAIVDRIV